MTSPETLLRRYLRQRGELGEREIVLDRISARDVAELLNGAPAAVAAHRLGAGPGGSSDAAPAAGPAPGGSRAVAPPVMPPPSGGTATPAPVQRVVVPIAPGATESASHEELREMALGCAGCALCDGRTHVVFGEGDPKASVMVVGEAPGREEDLTGRPFVGRAGKLLDLFLASVGFTRESVYICNVLKCRPPGNRNPRPEEIEACAGYLRRQLELVDPAVILAVGTFPAQTLLGSADPISRLRGRVHEVDGRPLVPTYHPAAVLRNPSWIRPVWEDLQRLREVLSSV